MIAIVIAVSVVIILAVAVIYRKATSHDGMHGMCDSPSCLRW